MVRNIINVYREAFRLFMRQRMTPIAVEEAEEKTLFWAKCYAITTLLSFSVATYITGKHKLKNNFSKDTLEQEIIEKLSDDPTEVVD